MGQGVQVVGIYVRDQEEARAYYTERVGFEVHTDVKNGDFRWLTLRFPGQETFQLGLFKPMAPLLDPASIEAANALVAKGAMPPLVLEVADCRAAYERMKAAGVEFTQEPVARFGSVDANFRDPSGNAWKLVQSRG